MPSRWLIDRGFTIAANETQQWWWQWFDDASSGHEVGPNKGPIIFRALPKGSGGGGNNSAENTLVTFDFARCRLSETDPLGQGQAKVFYRFKVRNESTVDVPMVLEMIRFEDLPIHHD